MARQRSMAEVLGGIPGTFFQGFVPSHLRSKPKPKPKRKPVRTLLPSSVTRGTLMDPNRLWIPPEVSRPPAGTQTSAGAMSPSSLLGAATSQPAVQPSAAQPQVAQPQAPGLRPGYLPPGPPVAVPGSTMVPRAALPAKPTEAAPDPENGSPATPEAENVLVSMMARNGFTPNSSGGWDWNPPPLPPEVQARLDRENAAERAAAAQRDQQARVAAGLTPDGSQLSPERQRELNPGSTFGPVPGGEAAVRRAEAARAAEEERERMKAGMRAASPSTMQVPVDAGADPFTGDTRMKTVPRVFDASGSANPKQSLREYADAMKRWRDAIAAGDIEGAKELYPGAYRGMTPEQAQAKRAKAAAAIARNRSWRAGDSKSSRQDRQAAVTERAKRRADARAARLAGQKPLNKADQAGLQLLQFIRQRMEAQNAPNAQADAPANQSAMQQAFQAFVRQFGHLFLNQF